MKRILSILSLCLLMIVGSVQSVEAQKAKATKKLIEVISKGSKNAPKKAAPIKKTTPRRVSPRPRSRVTTVKCSQCNGKGTVTVWNSYYGQYQNVRCAKCDGKGKVSHN